MKKLVQALTLAILAAGGPLLAQPEEGSHEIQVQAALSLAISSEADSNGTAVLKWGRFLTKSQEAGLTLTTLISDGDLAGHGGLFYRYNFSRGPVVPYVGASISATFGNAYGGADFLVSPEFGLRFFPQSDLAFTVAGNAPYDFGERELADSLDVLVGFSYYLQ